MQNSFVILNFVKKNIWTSAKVNFICWIMHYVRYLVFSVMYYVWIVSYIFSHVYLIFMCNCNCIKRYRSGSSIFVGNLSDGHALKSSAPKAINTSKTRKHEKFFIILICESIFHWFGTAFTCFPSEIPFE